MAISFHGYSTVSCLYHLSQYLCFKGHLTTEDIFPDIQSSRSLGIYYGSNQRKKNKVHTKNKILLLAICEKKMKKVKKYLRTSNEIVVWVGMCSIKTFIKFYSTSDIFGVIVDVKCPFRQT